jgi:hypothetical protein
VSSLLSHIRGISKAEGFLNWALSKICGFKWEEVVGRIKEIANEELHDL